MGDEQKAGAASAAHFPHQREHAVGGTGVEIAGRFIGQHQRWIVCQRACDCDALLLAAGESRRQFVCVCANCHTFKQRNGTFATFAKRKSFGKVHRQHDVLGGR
jgi:hypothetical protein